MKSAIIPCILALFASMILMGCSQTCKVDTSDTTKPDIQWVVTNTTTNKVQKLRKNNNLLEVDSPEHQFKIEMISKDGDSGILSSNIRHSVNYWCENIRSNPNSNNQIVSSAETPLRKDNKAFKTEIVVVDSESLPPMDCGESKDVAKIDWTFTGYAMNHAEKESISTLRIVSTEDGK